MTHSTANVSEEDRLIGNALLGTCRSNVQPLTLTLSATMHSVTDGRTDRLTDVSIVTIADHTACSSTIG